MRYLMQSLCFTVIVAGAPLLGQARELPVGARVRVTWQRGDLLARVRTTTVGDVVCVGADSLVLRTGANAATVPIARAAIVVLDRSLGASRRHTAVRFSAIAAVMWAGLAYAADRSVSSPKREVQVLAWGAAGATVGAVWGWNRPAERWKRDAP